MRLLGWLIGAALVVGGAQAETPPRPQMVAQHGHRVGGVSFTADSRRAISVSFRTVKVWNLENAQLLHSWEAGSLRATSPDGRRLALAGNKEVLIRDLHDGRALRRLRAGKAAPEHIVFAGQDRVLGASKGLVVWSLADGRVISDLRPEKAREAKALKLTGDGKLAVTLHGQRLRVWDAATGGLLREIEAKWGYALHVPTKGHFAVVAGGNRGGTLALFDLDSGERLDRHEVGGAVVRSLGHSPDPISTASQPPASPS